MRKALVVSGLALVSPWVVTLAGCGNGAAGTGGSGGSGGSISSNQATTGNASTGNASTGNASTGNASTGNASTGNASTSNASTANVGSTVATTSVASTTTGGGDMEPANMTGMTAAHNAARAAVMPVANPAIPPLAWSSTVATYAQTYSENCVFAHSGGPYGENIFATSGSATPQQVVTDWVSEDASYNYANNSCSGVCGHYTQVVWRESMNLGCGVTNCTTGSPFGSGNWQLWVCDYDPPGNFNNMKPY